MNDSTPQIPDIQTNALPYKDRLTGLRVFGIFTLLLGILSGMFVPLMFLGQVVAAKATKSPVSFATLLPAASVYGILSVALIWLGIGSIQARRWARALLVIFSWSWLGVGIISLIGMAMVVPKVMGNMPSAETPDHPAMPTAAKTVAMVFMFGFFGCAFIILPALWTFFYGSHHVKATCEARDPAVRWTDACPLPVLGVSLWLVFSVPMLLITSLSGHAVMPFFGLFLTGIPGVLFCLLTSAVWLCAAWLLYKLKPEGWWLILIALVVVIASSLVTFSRHDIIEMYQLMGYPQAQIDQIQQAGMMTGNGMVWWMTFCTLPVVVYLLWIKKYFRNNSELHRVEG